MVQLTRKARPLRVVNILSQQEDELLVACEDTIANIQVGALDPSVPYEEGATVLRISHFHRGYCKSGNVLLRINTVIVFARPAVGGGLAPNL